jgi:drug/metabolite transporter (DMT)-like permease
MANGTVKNAAIPPSWFGLINLLIVYIVWGSTYLAIRIGVKEGSGFPPFYLAGTRVLVAACILLFIAYLQKKRIKPTRRIVWGHVMAWRQWVGLIC